jgi:hypothetical protein
MKGQNAMSTPCKHGMADDFITEITVDANKGILRVDSLDNDGRFEGLAIADIDQAPPLLSDHPYAGESFYLVYHFTGGELGTEFKLEMQASPGIELKYDSADFAPKSQILKGNWKGSWEWDMCWLFQLSGDSSNQQQWIDIRLIDINNSDAYVGGKIFVNVLPARNLKYERLFNPVSDKLGFWIQTPTRNQWNYDYYGLSNLGKELFEPADATVIDKIAGINSNYYMIGATTFWLPDYIEDRAFLEGYRKNMDKFAAMIKRIRPDNKVMMTIQSWCFGPNSPEMSFCCNMIRGSKYIDGLVYDWETEDYTDYNQVADFFRGIRNMLGTDKEFVCTPFSYVEGRGLRWSLIDDVVDWFMPMYYIPQDTIPGEKKFLEQAVEWACNEWKNHKYSSSKPVVPLMIPVHKGNTNTPAPVELLYDSMRVSSQAGHPGALIYRPYSLTQEQVDMLKQVWGEFDVDFSVSDVELECKIDSDGCVFDLSFTVQNTGKSDANFDIPYDVYAKFSEKGEHCIVQDCVDSLKANQQKRISTEITMRKGAVMQLAITINPAKTFIFDKDLFSREQAEEKVEKAVEISVEEAKKRWFSGLFQIPPQKVRIPESGYSNNTAIIHTQ